MSELFPAYYISHGGGPWPWMPAMREQIFPVLEQSLIELAQALPEQPRAILMVSGHWEADVVRIQSSPNPGMEYDYYGFPPETYEIVYPAPGAPDVAEQVSRLLDAAGIANALDAQYGYDHGTFVPAYIMYPQADVPLFQVSMLHGYDPQAHYELGKAMRSLREQGVLIIGSGLSYHNLAAMRSREAWAPSRQFDEWLYAQIMLPDAQRWSAVRQWEQAPAARQCHPKEDHLAPLFVALGAAGADKATRVYHETALMGGIHASSYRFG